MTLTSTLRTLRQELGLNLRQVATATRMSIATLSRLERGRDCTLSQALAIVKFYGTTVDQVWSIPGEG